MIEPLTQLWPGLGLLFGLALLFSALGFYRVVYFVSVGYAFSIVAMVAAGLFAGRQNLMWATLLQSVCLSVWGLRLGVYILRRDFQAAYRTKLESVQERGAGIGFWQKGLIWIGVSILYVCMVSPNWFGLVNQPTSTSLATSLIQGVGGLIMVVGLVIETVADQQKSAFKARFPRQFCDQGLYQWVRCPNYLGEIMVWVGSWIIGATFFNSTLQWVMSTVGLVCIVLIMMGSTKRLEHEQGERYGQLPAYQTYSRQVPILFPFLPLYTLQHIRVYLE